MREDEHLLVPTVWIVQARIIEKEPLLERERRLSPAKHPPVVRLDVDFRGIDLGEDVFEEFVRWNSGTVADPQEVCRRYRG
jgi:hypothetical protein